ncbi:stress protein [Bacillus sp. DX1.1]|uniref:stress protein n=1 Tax=unclassified Bacillus (in: firmicutes) TaxID=185979 RepID=UPI0025705AEF|nr:MULTISPECIES: stress protein [unclassified Bacillus (in: firmicutes)]MDM5152688.1 stress protein [Bacillus sp. DX1.1]MDM5186008.1 stress protein [Bacillus sp. DX4.1]WJE84413.1 stress protein [Bacillus sp. DX3.1]
MKKMKKLTNIALAGAIGLGGLGAFAPTDASAAEISPSTTNVPTNLSTELPINFVESQLPKEAKASANLSVNVDVLGIANMIRDSINTQTNRSGFVKGVMESAFYAAGQRYNVMVFNLNQNYDDHFNGVKFFGTTVYDGITFGIWVFEDGEFTNQGDGGWINWAFRGWFDRNGSHVKFYRG